MFDFFKDMYAEFNGLDTKKIREEKLAKKKEKLVLSRTAKIIIRVIGVFYLFIAALSIFAIIKNGYNVIIFKYIIMGLLDIIILIMTFIRSKQAEIAVIFGAVFFIAINYLTTGF